jgi:hypothetical protein
VKKIVFVFVLGVGLCRSALMAEWQLGAAFSYSNSSQPGYGGQRDMNAPGAFFTSFYFLENVPIGFLSAVSIHSTDTMDFNGKAVPLSWGIPIHLNAGLGVRINCTERIKIIAGPAFHWTHSLIVVDPLFLLDDLFSLEEADEFNKYALFVMGLGISVLASVNIDLFSWLTLSAGCLFAWDFYSPAGDISGTYTLPYVGLGIKKK